MLVREKENSATGFCARLGRRGVFLKVWRLKSQRRAVEMAFRWLLEEGRSLEGITNVEVAKMAAVDEKTAARARGQIVESLDTIPEKSDEPRINGVSSSAEIERLQAELADAKSKAHELDSLRKRLKDEQDRQRRGPSTRSRR